MSTFQVIIYGIAQAFGEFLPISATGQVHLLSQVLGWPLPDPTLQGYFVLGTLLAALIYFIHDWASMISSLLGVMIFRKKPMTPDERMPFFILISAIPTALSWYYLRSTLPEFLYEPTWVAASMAIFGLPLIIGDYLSRKTKGMFDWNWLDSIMLGLGQILQLIPGAGRMTGALSIGMLRNYRRDACAKFSYFAAVPLLAGEVILNFQDNNPVFKGGIANSIEPTSGLSIALAITISFFTGLLAIGGMMKMIQRRNPSAYSIYRIVAAGVIFLSIWARARGVHPF